MKPVHVCMSQTWHRERKPLQTGAKPCVSHICPTHITGESSNSPPNKIILFLYTVVLLGGQIKMAQPID